MRTRPLVLASLVLLLTTAASNAGWGFGFSIGVPYRSYPHYRPYWHRPAVIVAPAAYPVYVAPPPVVVRPAPVVAVHGYESGYESPDVPAVPAVPDASPVSTPVSTRPPVARGTAPAAPDLTALSDPSAKVRSDAAVRLGRAKDRRAVKPLTRQLREDGTPEVREAAARALGLIGDPAALSALQYAAQADDDRDVRRSASFAADVIRANLRR